MSNYKNVENKLYFMDLLIFALEVEKIDGGGEIAFKVDRYGKVQVTGSQGDNSALKTGLAKCSDYLHDSE